jgi:rfaE bifunctional protein kinase chain/domain
MEDFQKLFASFATLKVGVIGDLMLDTYIWGHVDRISPEAPVPVVTIDEKEYRIGGAGNVALNCHSLGASVALLSVTGDDAESILLEELLETNGIDHSWLLKSSGRLTTHKTRIISRNQQMLRLDAETQKDITSEEEHALIEKVKTFISAVDPDVMIFEDYNKGVLTPFVIESVIHLCRDAGIITAVDPKRKNFFTYRKADIFKPNLKEVREGLNLLQEPVTAEWLQQTDDMLREKLDHAVSLVTLSEKGIFYHDAVKGNVIPSHLRHIADVSGAGDTVIAVAAMVYAVTKNIHLMADVANIAGGLVCEEVGTVAINRDKLLNECEILLS